uniref:Uncharacterized protein n=1 Tax=Toxoplasma gondii COUG TaxID=1074873 RepID=A0A2G8Y031_TOXGO|nr:hypothetical protein TGCOUG_313840 [Toxoplasma gondii COUG]
MFHGLTVAQPNGKSRGVDMWAGRCYRVTARLCFLVGAVGSSTSLFRRQVLPARVYTCFEMQPRFWRSFSVGKETTAHTVFFQTVEGANLFGGRRGKHQTCARLLSVSIHWIAHEGTIDIFRSYDSATRGT